MITQETTQTQEVVHRTLEFKILPTPEQEQKLNEWLRITQWVWNRALGLMEEYRSCNIYDSETKSTTLCCPIAFYDKRAKKDVYFDIPQWRKEIEPELIKKGKKEIWVQPVKIAEHIPALKQLPTSKKNTPLVTLFGHRYHKDREIKIKVEGEEKTLKYTDCPFKFIQGVLMILSGSWVEFIKRPNEVSPPKFKNSKHPIKTLIHFNADQLKVDYENETITLHRNIGAIKIENLLKRLKPETTFNPLKICKKASGWYLQVTVEEEVSGKLTGLSCGIDPGKIYVAALDNDFLIKPLKPLKKQHKRMLRLQRQLARKGRMNNKERKEGEKWIKSKNWQRLSQRLGKLHEKIARSRRSFNHWYSSLLTDWFDLIFLGDFMPSIVSVEAKPITNENGEIKGYAKNNQCVQRGHNKSSLDIALGQFKELIRTKAKEKGKVVVEVKEGYTSQVCPNCGNIEKKGKREDKKDNLSVREHCCKKCGFDGNRDTVGAINIKLKGIADLLSKTDSELEQIPNLKEISQGSIRKYLESEEMKILKSFRGSLGVYFNVWRLIAVIGIKSYLKHTTENNESTIFETTLFPDYLLPLQQYYNEKIKTFTK